MLRKLQKILHENEYKFRLGELFCGPGGLALGALQAQIKAENATYSIEHAWASDYDIFACNTYRRNICPDKPESVICIDVRELDIERLPEIDCFAFGFPCNDFSIVGEHKGFEGRFGPLYTYGIKVLNKFKPSFFVAENVSGLSSANGGRALKKILHDLRNAGNGYGLSVHVYHAEDYGIPQTRHRLVIVGIAQEFGLHFHVPKPTTKFKPVTSKEALENPPIPADASNNEKTKQSRLVIERLKHIKHGENVWNANLPDHLKINAKKAKLSQIYRRLDPDLPSYTITGSGGGGTHCYHYTEDRALTNRERARLQTFPDDFIFEGPKEMVRKQIGMAVPPKMAQVIFTAILKTISKTNYDCINPKLDDQLMLFAV